MKNRIQYLLLFSLLLTGAPSALGSGLDSWAEGLSAWGDRPEGVAVIRALEDALFELPPGALKSFLTRRAPRTSNPWCRFGLERLLAGLERQQGRLEKATALIRGGGVIFEWTLILPTRLEGTRLRADPATGLVNPRSFVKTSGLHTLVLEHDLEVRKEQEKLRILVTGPGVEAVSVDEQEHLLQPANGVFQDQADVRIELSRGGHSLRIRLRPDMAGRSFSVRVTADRGDPLPLELLEERFGLGGGERKPVLRDEEVFGLAVLLRLGRLESVPPAWLEEIVPQGIPALDRLRAMTRGRPDIWDRLCARTPACQAPGVKELYQLKQALDRNQLYLSLRILARLQAAGPAFPPGGLLANRWLRARAELLQSLGMPLRAARLLRTNPTPPEALSAIGLDARLQAELTSEDLERSLTLLNRRLAHWPGDRSAGSVLLTLLKDSGRLREGAVRLRRLTDLYPTDTGLALEVERALAGLDPDAALKRLRILADRAPAKPEVWEVLGEIRMLQQDSAGALKAWNRALELDPQNRALALRVRQRTGESKTWTQIQRPLDWIRRQTGTNAGGHQVSGISDTWYIRLHESGLASIYRQQVIRVNDPGPSRRLDMSEHYDPHVEEFTTLSSGVLRGTGKFLQTSLGDDRSLSDEEYNLYYDIRRRHRIFQNLQAGDLVVWEYRIDQLRGSMGGFSLIRFLQEGYPRRTVRFVVDAPPGMELHHRAGVQQGTPPPVFKREEREKGVRYDWVFGPLPALLPIPNAPPPPERSAWIALSTQGSWTQVREWYGRLLSQRSLPSPDMGDWLAENIDDSLKSLEKLERVARFVADGIRYVGLEFGVNAYVPYPTARVFERRFGDCKDMSLLTTVLLKQLGIPAVMAVVRTYPRGLLDDAPPSLSVFDHAIVYLPEQDQWFDPTAHYLGLEALPWQDQGAQALLLTDPPRVTRVPVQPSARNRTRVHLTIAESTEPGKLSIQGTLEFFGAMARANIAATRDTAGWNNRVERFLAGYLPGLELQSADHVFQEDESGCLVISVQAFLPDKPGALRILSRLRFQQRLARLTERSEDLFLTYPFQERVELLSDTPRLRFTGPGEQTDEGPGCRLRIQDVKPDRLALLLDFPERILPVKRYAAFRSALGRIDALLSQMEATLAP